jgi:glucose-6-phosphate 1-dehydrogenase
MSNLPSDAIVFFGASGDLAYKQIFPSLLRLVRDEGSGHCHWIGPARQAAGRTDGWKRC